AGAVGADVGPASALVDLAVLPDHEVVTSPAPSVGEVDRFDVLRDPRAGGLRGRTAVVVDEEVCAGREGRAVRRPSPRLGAPAGAADDLHGILLVPEHAKAPSVDGAFLVVFGLGLLMAHGSIPRTLQATPSPRRSVSGRLGREFVSVAAPTLA